jgi:hypothetical protein
MPNRSNYALSNPGKNGRLPPVIQRDGDPYGEAISARRQCLGLSNCAYSTHANPWRPILLCLTKIGPETPRQRSRGLTADEGFVRHGL